MISLWEQLGGFEARWNANANLYQAVHHNVILKVRKDLMSHRDLTPDEVSFYISDELTNMGYWLSQIIPSLS